MLSLLLLSDQVLADRYATDNLPICFPSTVQYSLQSRGRQRYSRPTWKKKRELGSQLTRYLLLRRTYADLKRVLFISGVVPYLEIRLHAHLLTHSSPSLPLSHSSTPAASQSLLLVAASSPRSLLHINTRARTLNRIIRSHQDYTPSTLADYTSPCSTPLRLISPFLGSRKTPTRA